MEPNRKQEKESVSFLGHLITFPLTYSFINPLNEDEPKFNS